MPNPFKVSLYIRVSTDRQANEGDSLDEQERELKRFCEFKQFHIHKVHIEAGRSAKDTKRPEYQKLMEDIEAEKINAVVVKKLDRLSRSLLDFEGFMTLAQKHKVEFISIKENFDTTNAMGTAMLRVALVFAQLEREQLSERVSDVMIYRARQGLYNGGGIPYGYDVVNKELVPHKQEKKIVETMFKLFLEDKSTTVVAKALNAMGAKARNGTYWQARDVDKYLRRPVYTGKMIWGNQIYPGLHQPLVTKDVFKRVQEIFSQRQYQRANTKIKGVLRHLLYCGKCQSLMLPTYACNRHKKLYYYYRCTSILNPEIKDTCNVRYIAMDDTDRIVFSKLLDLATENQLKAIETQLHVHNAKIAKQAEVLTVELSALEKQLKIVRLKKERYLDSLVRNQFQNEERQAINAKIDEFTLEEKQRQAQIYTGQFELTQKQGQTYAMDDLKRELIFLKVNHKILAEAQLGEWLHKNIARITYSQQGVTVRLKNYPVDV